MTVAAYRMQDPKPAIERIIPGDPLGPVVAVAAGFKTPVQKVSLTEYLLVEILTKKRAFWFKLRELFGVRTSYSRWRKPRVRRGLQDAHAFSTIFVAKNINMRIMVAIPVIFT